MRIRVHKSKCKKDVYIVGRRGRGCAESRDMNTVGEAVVDIELFIRVSYNCLEIDISAARLLYRYRLAPGTRILSVPREAGALVFLVPEHLLDFFGMTIPIARQYPTKIKNDCNTNNNFSIIPITMPIAIKSTIIMHLCPAFGQVRGKAGCCTFCSFPQLV